MDLIVDLHGPPPLAELPASAVGRGLALRLHTALRRAGFACDEPCALGDAWGFLVEAERSPIGITVAPDDADAGRWHVGASYEGGLSALWGGERRAGARALLARIEAAICDTLDGRTVPRRH